MDCPYSRIDMMIKEWNEDRIDRIGQNGNDGDHYNVVPLSPSQEPSNEEWEQLELDLPDPPEAA
jgi:hypothetical protein